MHEWSGGGHALGILVKVHHNHRVHVDLSEVSVKK